MYNSIKPGQPWLDTNGKRIQAHGGSVMYLDGAYYWYGENKENTITYQAALFNIGVNKTTGATNYSALGREYYTRLYYVLECESGTRTVYDTAYKCSFFDVAMTIENEGSGSDYNDMFGTGGYMSNESTDTVNGQTVFAAYTAWKNN